jgi:PAS domain S-box-containing protein
MSMSYAYTPHIWPSVFTALLLIALAFYCMRRRSVPGALPFAIGSLFGALWVAGSIMEAAAVDMETKIFWFKVQAVCQLPAFTALTCSILEYACPGRWLTRRNLILLIVPCLLALGFALTDPIHHLIWRGFEVHGKILPIRGPVNWIYVIYAYGLTFLNLIVFTWLFARSPQHRWPVVIMLTGMVAGRALILLESSKILQSEAPPFMLEYLTYAIALFGFRIFDPIPMARRTAIEQLHSGMLVLDPQGKIVSLNAAACALFGLSQGRLLGCSIQDLLPACSGLIEDLQLAGKGRGEISLGSGLDAHYYQAEVSSLNDWRGLTVGLLFLLHDVTDQKKAQEQLVDQQRALATLKERERMARELHDSLGQVLGYAGLQVEVAAKLSRDGQGEAAANHLDRLRGVIREAHADVREYILDLRSTPSLQQPFFTVLQQYLEGFTNNYAIKAQLTLGPGMNDEAFSADNQLQIFRIVQEALSNARKHGHARQVQVIFTAENRQACITVRDDGVGFDPVQTAGESHFGLRFMRERAEALGGTFRVQSVPGQGTCVEVNVPVEGRRP